MGCGNDSISDGNFLKSMKNECLAITMRNWGDYRLFGVILV